VLIEDAATFRFGAADNSPAFPLEIDLSGAYRPSSICGVWIDGRPAAVVGASGGATTVQSDSALVLGERLFLAVGPQVVCLTLRPCALVWSAEADWATCFGLHWSPAHAALICHGELAISRLSTEGEVLWTQAGADIITGDFTLRPDWIEARDFDDVVYRFRYEDGGEVAPP